MGLKFSDFFETKDGMVEPTCSKMNQWKQQGKPVKIVQMDNAEENLKLAKAANGKDWKLNLEIEYTGKATSQRNHLVELGFATLWARARATMIDAKVPLAIRYLVCKECIVTVTLLHGLVTTALNGQMKTSWFEKPQSLPRNSNLGVKQELSRQRFSLLPSLVTEESLASSLVTTWIMAMLYIACGIRIPNDCFGTETFNGWEDIILTWTIRMMRSPTTKSKCLTPWMTMTRQSKSKLKLDVRIEDTSAVVGFIHQEAVVKLKLSNIESNYYAALMNLSCA